MSVWEKFEIDSTDYLNRVFNKYAHFDCRGGSNSTVSDIEVMTNSGRHFYIEAKHCPAQCGQFVLLPNVGEGKFEYSRQNATLLNPYSESIIKHMNSRFDEYKEAGTAGKPIEMENGSSIFAAWIVQAYRDKGAEFIITNGNIIIPVDDFSNSFYISAKYRVKRSGSNSVGSGRMDAAREYLESNFSLTSVQRSGDKLFATSDSYLHNRRFVIAGTEYMISGRGERYEIRRLSNTFNANVIFSIELKECIRGLSYEEFASFLKQ